MFKIEKGHESVNKTFRIPEDIVAKLEKLAGKHNISVNNVVVQCLTYALENLDAEEDNSNQ